MSEKVDKKWMLEALLLAGKGVGKTRPNPPVGAVVVKGNAIIGSGWHRKAGGPHAEVYALKEAGTRARNSTLYVTLEPCSTTGRTLACTQAILDAGIRRIVVAVRDPNPAHAGRGLALLRRRGITVTCGVCKTEAQALIEPFKKWVTTGVPWVTLKMAMSLDGRIADVNGNSKWITGSQARHEVQSMRRRADAILVGAETVRQDNPSLYPRPAQGRKPHRIIVSSDGKIPLKSKVLTDAFAASTIIATSKTCSTTQSAALARKGASVKSFPQKVKGVSLPHILSYLGAQGMLHVLVEGGGHIAGSLVRHGLVDELVVFVAPCLLGGAPAKSVLSGVDWSLQSKRELQWVEQRPIGNDILLRARVSTQ